MALTFSGGALLGACEPPPPADEPEPCAACALGDASNFSYVADLDVDVVPQRAEEDAVLDWSSLTRDLHGHAVAPLEDIATAQLVALRDLSPDEVADGLARDMLEMVDVTLFVGCAPDRAACALSEFGLGGSPVDVPAYFVEGTATWLFLLESTFEAGAASFLFLDPRDDATATVAALTDTSSRLAVDVDLHSLSPVRVEAGRADIVVDWSALTRDGLGHALPLASIDGISLGRYDVDVADLEEHVFDLDALALERWELPVAGQRSAALDALTGDTDFSGIDDGSTWLLALRCSSCLNPTPRFLTVLVPGQRT